MIKYNHLKNCKHLVLYTSESCSLQCNYCDMAQHVQAKRHADEAKKVKESLINGVYLENLKKAFDRLEIDGKQIENCELWGQEPTLTLKEFSIFFPELLKLCPNMKKLFFSTNGVGFTDEILNLIKIISNIITKEYTFAFQFSYDGRENTQKQRGISPDIIIKNIENFLTKLNTVVLNPLLTVDIQFHSVTDDTIINKYSDINLLDDLYNHLFEFEELSDKFISLNTNPNVHVGNFSPGLICPFNASVEEGKALVQYYNNCEKVGKNLKHKTWRGLTAQTYLPFVGMDYENIIQVLKKVINKTATIEDLKPISGNMGCNYSYHSLKIRYDGTLMHCQSAIMGLTEDEIIDKTGLSYDAQRQKIIHGFYPNIITDSDEVISNYLYQVELYSEQSFPLAFSQAVNLMLLLLQAEQIDKNYINNIDKFLWHSFIMSLHNGCPWNNMIENGSILGRSTGRMRFLCNGFLDLCDPLYQKTKEERRE